MKAPYGLTTFALLIGCSTAFAESPPGTADLPVTRIVLFTSGVGYFQRDGHVEGNSRIDLQFSTGNINDLLKSLILQDQDGGSISTVNYDNRDPIEKALKSFAIDLTQNPTVGDLLNQVRGEQVEVVVNRDGKAVTLTGEVVGMEKVKRPAGKDSVIDVDQLNLLTGNGIESVPLDRTQRIRFTRPELEQEFRKALRVLARGHDKDKKTVSLNFEGAGKRSVRVGYVTESPIWKTSYRLGLDKGKGNKVFLQGWAIVENTTDEDWHGVRLGLVAGRPISFRMDLYEPLYLKRPLVEPELFASLRPPSYEGNLKEQDAAAKSADGVPAPQAPGVVLGRRAGAVDAMRQRKMAENRAASPEELNLQQGVASAAIATELGDYFQYQIEHPVSLPRQKSALLPIVNGPVEASRVSIYNNAVQPKFPLLGLRFKNTTGLHLMQGPVTVFEGQSYAGDARVSDLQPGETRLLSYAIDLGTEVALEAPNPADNLIAIRIFKGILHATHKVRYRHVYKIKNRSDKERLLLVEQPSHPQLKLLGPSKPAERTRDMYRFEVHAEPNKPVELNVEEEESRVDLIALTDSSDETIGIYLRSGKASDAVKEALEKAMHLKGELAETQHQIGREEQAVKVIEDDQSRMRANIARVPPTSEAYKRYLKKFDDQETEIEKRRAEISRLQNTAETQRKAYETFLANLNVE